MRAGSSNPPLSFRILPSLIDSRLACREAAKASRIFEEQERVMSLAAREAGAVLRLIEQQARDRAGAQPGGR